MSVGIYKITNIVTNKFYIGSSVNIEKRWKKHIWALNNHKHGNSHLQQAWDKYGESNFKFEILQQCTEEELKTLETQYIQNTKCYESSIGYNMVLDANRNLINEEARQKLREAATGNKNWLGKKHTEEAKKKQSLWHIGKEVKQSTRDKLREINTGKKLSEETKKKMRSSKLGKKLGKDNPRYGKIKEQNHFYGKTHTEETKRIISEKLKARWKKNMFEPHPVFCKELNVVFPTVAECSRQLNITKTRVIKCCKGQYEEVDGYHLKYYKEEK